MLEFTDGITIDTQGPLRRHKEYDGLYIVGRGMLVPCRDEAEVERLLRELQPNTAKETSNDHTTS